MMKRWLSVCLSFAMLCACLAGCAPGGPAQPGGEQSWDAPEAVVSFAMDHLAEGRAFAHAREGGGEVLDTQLTGLTRLASLGDILPGALIEVYQMQYRVQFEHPEKIVMAGGMSMDEAGWLLELSSMGRPCLAVLKREGEYSLLSELWDGEVSLEGGWEAVIGALLVDLGNDANDDEMVAGGWTAFARAWLARADETVMDSMLAHLDEAGPAYTDDSGVLWLPLPGFEKWAPDLRMDDQVLGRAHAVFSGEISAELFRRYVYRPDGVFLERDGVLYVRSDAAEAIGWDYTVDLTTITIIGSAPGEYLAFTAAGTGRGGALTWLFQLEHAGNWAFTRYYDLGPDPAVEYSLLADGRWFGLNSREQDPDFGPVDSTVRSAQNVYEQGDEWLTTYYSHVTTTRYLPASGAYVASPVYLSVTKPGLPTWRGVEVGDTLSRVRDVYPELAGQQPDADEPSGLSVLRYSGPEERFYGYHIEFYFDAGGVLSRIDWVHYFD